MPLATYEIKPTVAVILWGNLRAPVNPRELSSEREANLLGTMLSLQPSIPAQATTGKAYDWGTETRRPWEVGDRLNVGEMLYQMGGINAAGNWSKDANGEWQWNVIFANPTPSPVAPRPPLVPGPDEVLVDWFGVQVIRKKADVETGAVFVGQLDALMAAVQDISQRLTKIGV